MMMFWMMMVIICMMMMLIIIIIIIIVVNIDIVRVKVGGEKDGRDRDDALGTD